MLRLVFLLAVQLLPPIVLVLFGGGSKIYGRFLRFTHSEGAHVPLEDRAYNWERFSFCLSRCFGFCLLPIAGSF